MSCAFSHLFSLWLITNKIPGSVSSCITTLGTNLDSVSLNSFKLAKAGQTESCSSHRYFEEGLVLPTEAHLRVCLFFFLERKKITLTVGNQLSYKKIYNVVGYLKGKRNPGVYIQYASTSCCIAACLNMSVFEKGSDRQKYDGAMHSLSHPTQPSHNLDLV